MWNIVLPATRRLITSYGQLRLRPKTHLLLLTYLLQCLLRCLQCFDAVGWAAGRACGCKKQWWGAGVVICLEQGADLHIAQLMPLPLTVSCFSKVQIGFTFLVPAHPGSPGQRAVKWACVCAPCRSHNKALIPKATYLSNGDSIMRMLYKNCY